MPIIQQEGFAIKPKTLRLTSKEEKALNEFLEKEPFKGDNWSDSMRKLIQFTMKNYPKLSSHEPSETSNEKQAGNFFDCQKLCKKFDKCREDMNTSINMLDEITRDECYDSKFPFINPYTGKLTCPLQEWETDFADDSEHPYPKCNAKQKDVPFKLPKDRIIRNPELAWLCVMTRSKKRKEAWKKKQLQLTGKYIKEDLKQKIYCIDGGLWVGIAKCELCKRKCSNYYQAIKGD